MKLLSSAWRLTAFLSLVLLQSLTLSSFHVDNHSPVVIIVGAGPIGLATSLALSPICQKVYLIEHRASFERQGAVLTLSLREQECLRVLDPELYERVAATLAIVDPTSQSWLCLWSELRDALLDAARKRSCYRGGNIQFCMGLECVALEVIEGRVVVKFKKGGIPLVADFVVGADDDGLSPVVRNALQSHIHGSSMDSNATYFQGNLYVSDSSSPKLLDLVKSPELVPFSVDLGAANLSFQLIDFHRRHPRRLAWTLTSRKAFHHGGSTTIHSVLRDHVKDPELLGFLEDIVNRSDTSSWKPYPKRMALSSQHRIGSTSDREGLMNKLIWLGARTTSGDTDDDQTMGIDDVVLLRHLLQESGDLSERLRRFELERMTRQCAKP